MCFTRGSSQALGSASCRLCPVSPSQLLTVVGTVKRDTEELLVFSGCGQLLWARLCVPRSFSQELMFCRGRHLGPIFRD